MQHDHLIEHMKSLGGVWDTKRVHESISDFGGDQSLRSTERLLESLADIPQGIVIVDMCDEDLRPLRTAVVDKLQTDAKKNVTIVLFFRLLTPTTTRLSLLMMVGSLDAGSTRRHW